MTEAEPIIPRQPSNPVLESNGRNWILVPLIAFAGVLIGWAVPSLVVLAGTGGCVLASVFLAFIAYQKPKKDIVSLLTPLYAVLIFFNDSFTPALLTPIQGLYAASLTILVLRLNARFSQKDEARKQFTEEEEEPIDEPVSE